MDAFWLRRHPCTAILASEATFALGGPAPCFDLLCRPWSHCSRSRPSASTPRSTPTHRHAATAIASTRLAGWHRCPVRARRMSCMSGKRGNASAGASSVVARKARQPKRELKVARNGKCPSGFNGCLAHKTSLGTTRSKASAICRRLCAGRAGKGLKRKGAKSRGVKQARGARANGGKKCPKGYNGCLAYKTRLGTPRNKAAAICRRVCAK